MKEAKLLRQLGPFCWFSVVSSHSQIKPHTSTAHTLSQARSPF